MNTLKLIKYAWKSAFAVSVSTFLVLGSLVIIANNARADEVTGSASPTPRVTPSPAPTPPSFPACLSLTPPGDNAHYASGLHQIVGNGLLEGQDDVFSIGNGNFVQCFVPPAKDVCIQTDWWRTDAVLDGWYSVNGSQWNLGNFHYLARNHNYNCIPPSPSPSPTPVPTPTPTEVPTPTPVTIINNNTNNTTVNNDNNQSQSQTNNQTNNQGTVLGVKKTPETGPGELAMAGMFGAGPVGFALSKFGKVKLVSKKKIENLNEIVLGIVKSRTDRIA